MNQRFRRGGRLLAIGAGVTAALAVSPIAIAQSQTAVGPLTVDAPMMELQTDRIIVKYRDSAMTGNAAKREAKKARKLARLERRLARKLERLENRSNGNDVIKLKRMERISELQTIISELQADPEVEYAEPDLIMQPLLVPNDSQYNQQWHYFEPAGGLNLEPAWDMTTSDSGVVVAVIDSGIRPHVDFGNRILPGYDFISDAFISNDGNGRDADPSDTGDATTAGECGNDQPTSNQSSSWHGTHVAGTIAAGGNNGFGVAGVAWNASILPLRALGKCGGYTSDIADAMRWAAGLTVAGIADNPNPAQVLNMSLGGASACSNTYQQAINAVRATGATIVVAAGNSNTDAAGFTPASCDGVVSVAATDRNGGRSYYSNFGNSVDIAAPGGELYSNSQTGGVLSTYNSGQTAPGGDSYGYLQGTSMAAPHVAGLLALMYSVAGDLTPDEAEAALIASARAFPATGNDACTAATCGAGIADAEAAVLAVTDAVEPEPEPPVELQNGVVETGVAAGQGEMLYFTMTVPAGQESLSFTMSGGSGDADLYVRYGAEPTLSDYDFRPYLNGNNEAVEIAAPQAGVWHVMIAAYSDFADVQLVGNFQEPPPPPPRVSEFDNPANVAIPDRNSAGIYSNIAVDKAGASGSITIEVDIKHTYIGDLEIWIYAPNGASGKLKSISNDSSDDLQQSFTLNAGTIPAAGTWRLRVADRYRGDVGFIDEWSITFND